MTQTQMFDGKTFDPKLDGARLGAQLDKVRDAMLRKGWVTLAYLSGLLAAPEASVSARLRDLRKVKFGGYTVERRRVPNGNGLHEYRLVKP